MVKKYRRWGLAPKKKAPPMYLKGSGPGKKSRKSRRPPPCQRRPQSNHKTRSRYSRR